MPMLSDLDMNYYRFIQNGKDFSYNKYITAAETRRRITDDMYASINFEPNCLRNNEPQKFVVTTTEQVDKMDILAFPEEDLFIGDIIYCYGKNWIVKEVYATDFLQKKGKMLCCNLDLNFQISPSSQIITRPVCIDSGVYATAQKQQPEIVVPDSQYKMYAQIDDEIMQLYAGRRIATSIWYAKDGKKHLNCYQITAVDPQSLNFYDGHIVEFKLRSVPDDPLHDDIEHMICDYIPDDQTRDRFTKGGW